MTNKTLDQLTTITTPAGTDLFPILRPVAGALQSVTWSNIITALASTFASRANNLSDLADASTSRTNLGLGTAATQNTGTSGATVPLLNASVSWTGTVTATGFAGPLTGNVTGNVSGNAATASAVAAGSVTPAGLSTGHPTWNSTGDFTPVSVLSAFVFTRDAGNGHARLFFSATDFIEFDEGNHQIKFILSGSQVCHIDPVTAFTVP